MGSDITVDVSDFEQKFQSLSVRMVQQSRKAVLRIAEEALRLSQEVVPIKTGMLQNSGIAQQDGDEAIVGYNKVYAAYQHEGMRADGTYVVKKYSNDRSKRKFLEGPIKLNLDVFRDYYKKIMGELL